MITEAWTQMDRPHVGQLSGFGGAGLFHFFGVRGFSWSDLEKIGPAARLKQVHGHQVIRVEEKPLSSSLLGEGDALISDQIGIFLTVSTADCVPLLFFNPSRRAIGAAHAGWRGSVEQIGPQVVKALLEAFGGRAEDLHVAIGPSIGPCCYEVGREVLDRLSAMPGEILRPHGPDHARLDLAALNRHQLLAIGVHPERIYSASLCTACHVERFYSYRREGGLRGNMISGLKLT